MTQEMPAKGDRPQTIPFKIRSSIEMRFGLTKLRLEHLRIHLRHHLAGGQEVPFVDENGLDPACQFGRHIGLCGFDAAIASSDDLAVSFAFEELSGKQGGNRDDRSTPCGPYHPCSALTYHPLIPVRC